MPAHLADQGYTPQTYDPEDHPEEIVGGEPFDVLESSELVARVAAAGFVVPEDIQEQLRDDDDPARTLGDTVRGVTRTAALRLDRPGLPPEAHPEMQQMLRGAAGKAAERLSAQGANDPELSPEDVRKIDKMMEEIVRRREARVTAQDLRARLNATPPDPVRRQEHERAEHPEIDGPEYGDEGPERV
ncbi:MULTISPECIES: hypothetical protein [Parafrankia]|uniref:hypothetical protein n=1 Tax=Parafrankia TaxID=2994362 RepID=UPI0010424DB6|nr:MULTISPECIES: hypothetical protein [Parafrankia]MBE3206674.1 hypothetical protein [Parafrankia sp. CH37]